jgi:N-methylhydantoinase A/oxoprolinase/acetone carboxylase beta subunit
MPQQALHHNCCEAIHEHKQVQDCHRHIQDGEQIRSALACIAVESLCSQLVAAAITSAACVFYFSTIYQQQHACKENKLGKGTIDIVR